MSQTPETPTTEKPETPREFLQKVGAAKDHLISAGAATGPAYRPQGQPLLWHDQIFGESIEPSSSFTDATPLLCSTNQNAVDLVLVGSPKNSGPVSCPSASTITVSFSTAYDQDGTYAPAGPSICFTAPEAGMKAEPGETLVRFPIPTLPGKWLKPKITFTGNITGGTLDCGLAYTPR